MVLNSSKCQITYLGNNTENETFFCNDTEMKNRREDKILGVTIDSKLSSKFLEIIYLRNLR